MILRRAGRPRGREEHAGVLNRTSTQVQYSDRPARAIPFPATGNVLMLPTSAMAFQTVLTIRMRESVKPFGHDYN